MQQLALLEDDQQFLPINLQQQNEVDVRQVMEGSPAEQKQADSQIEEEKDNQLLIVCEPQIEEEIKHKGPEVKVQNEAQQNGDSNIIDD